MYFSFFLIGLLIVLFVFRWRDCLKNSFFTKQSYHLFKEQFSYLGYQYHFLQHLFIVLSVLVVLALFLQIFSVELVYQLPIYFLSAFLVPDMILCILAQRLEEQKFCDVTLFLQHFIALFRQHQKIYQALIESRSYVSSNFQKQIDNCLDELKQGKSLHQACVMLYQQYPHFIIHHTFMCMETLEEQGGNIQDQGLDLILEDIDDWIEDTYAYKQEQLTSKNRILILCMMSMIIAFFAKNMMNQLEKDLIGQWYQYAMLFFFLCLTITVWNAHRILKKSWIDHKECIWVDLL